ncbi:MAG: carbon-nitrogen hydrolase family protein [Myxococcales bacterium]|nr:carbon-nitrogen hydrolase family protein [Myxococcales bacterium]
MTMPVPLSPPSSARVACVQFGMRAYAAFEDFERHVAFYVRAAADARADLVVLPEYVSIGLIATWPPTSSHDGIRRLALESPRVIELMRGLALTHGLTLVAGSHPMVRDGVLENVAVVCLPDGDVVLQPKLHVTPNERRAWGFSGGHELCVIDTPRARIGVLVCYDVEFPEAARALSDRGAELIVVPFCTDDRQGYHRVRYCAQARAIENQVYVAMAGTVGVLDGVPNMDVNWAKAAVLTPCDYGFARDGIAAESEPNEETFLVAELDFERLRAARAAGTVTPHLDRRPDLFPFTLLIR